MIEDGAGLLQMGIGAIPNSGTFPTRQPQKLRYSHGKCLLTAYYPLYEKGVVNNMNKKFDKGKIVSTFLMGSKRVYDFIDDNPGVAMMGCRLHERSVHHRTTTENDGYQLSSFVDITGQVNADSLGIKFYSGSGGQLDFIRGAAASEGGKPIIALPAVTNKGVSKICPTLLNGAGVVTTRFDVHYIVTEFGIADLYGKTLQERAKTLINIAHPDHRETLDKAAFERFASHYHFISK